MKIFIVVLFWFFQDILAVEDAHDHSHEVLSKEVLIDEIAEHIEATTKSNSHTVFIYKDIQTLFKELKFKNCSDSERSTCNLVSIFFS